MPGPSEESNQKPVSTAAPVLPQDGWETVLSPDSLASKHLTIFVEDYLNGVYLKGLNSKRFNDARREIGFFKQQEIDNAAREIFVNAHEGGTEVSTRTLREYARKIAADVLELQYYFILGATDVAYTVQGTARTQEVWKHLGLDDFSEKLANTLAPRFSISAGGFTTGCLTHFERAYQTSPHVYYGPQLGGWLGEYTQRPPEPRGGPSTAPTFHSIDSRTASIFAFSNLSAALFFPGGAGTAEELTSALLATAHASVNGTFFTYRRDVPLPFILIDAQLQGGAHYYDGFIEQIRRFNTFESKRLKPFIDNLCIVRPDGIYTFNNDGLTRSHVFGTQSAPDETIAYIVQCMEDTRKDLFRKGHVLPVEEAEPFLLELKDQISALREPLPEIPVITAAAINPQVYTAFQFQNRFVGNGKIWERDPVARAQDAAQYRSSYPGKPTHFGSVLSATLVSKSGEQIRVEFEGGNYAEGGRHTTCSEKTVVKRLEQRLLIDREIESVHIEGVFLHGSFHKDQPFRFYCSCQACREMYQDLHQRGWIDSLTVFAFQCGKEGAVLLSNFEQLVPLSGASKEQGEAVPPSFMVLDEDTLTANEKRLIDEACLAFQPQSIAVRGHSAFLLDGTVIGSADLNLPDDRSISVIRDEAAAQGKRIFQAFCYAVKASSWKDVLPGVRAHIRENYLTESQISGIDCWVYVVGVNSDDQIETAYRVRASELFPEGKGMADSKKQGGDTIGLVMNERRWHGKIVDGPIDQHPDFYPFQVDA